MDVIYRRVAGFDVHKKTVMVCVRLLSEGDQITKRVREFGTMTHELVNLRSWLASQGVTHVAMESTGVYWKPVWNVLEEIPLELMLSNAHDIKQVPGRKTDVKDCEWIARLLQHGLLRGSFVPSRALRNLRDLTRTRAKLVDEKTRHANRLQKILEDTNVKLGSVATDVLGVSGRAILQALLNGEDDPKQLAELARGRLRGKIPSLRFALDGRVTEHHRYMLQLHYSQVLHLERLIEELSARIETITGTADTSVVREDSLPLFPQLDGAEEPDEPPPDPGSSPSPPAPPAPEAPAPKAQAPEAQAPHADAAAHPPSADSASCRSLAPAIELLCTVPGIQKRTAENIVAEIGDDMSRFPTANHLASWAGIAPGNHESAGKRKSGKTTKGNRFLRRALTQAAWGAKATKGSYQSALYRRLVGKRGKKRAIVAVARSLLVTIYHMLERGTRYEELGADYFDRLNAAGVTRYHLGRLKKLGYEVTLKKADGEAA